MMPLRLGPLLLPTAPLLLLLGFWIAEMVARRLAGAAAARPGPALLAAALGGLLVARAAFVLRWRSQYPTLGAVLDVRDLGFDPWAGWPAAALVLLAWGLWRAPLRRALAAGLAAAALVVLGGQALLAALQPPPRMLPQLSLRDLQGRVLPLRSLRGQPLVINLWATWCPPCRRELPMLLAQAGMHPGARIVLADQGDPAAAVDALLRSLGHAGAPEVLLDPGRALAAHYEVPGYPTTLFIRADGSLQRMYVGEMSAATLSQGIRRLREVAR